ncbi:hypothetical protein EYF80_057866 [Liparis tanakae]|uniref:Uncharacterized protein n=1 Tax=Liparis tanakae TaxID=230148 RepID=A0A4Z2ET49_9TELE|nr:hypothetical protein EYF80_057866 [Liparis tanakae]
MPSRGSRRSHSDTKDGTADQDQGNSAEGRELRGNSAKAPLTNAAFTPDASKKFSTRLTQDSDARRKKGVHTGRVGRVETRRRVGVAYRARFFSHMNLFLNQTEMLCLHLSPCETPCCCLCSLLLSGLCGPDFHGPPPLRPMFPSAEYYTGRGTTGPQRASTV